MTMFVLMEKKESGLNGSIGIFLQELGIGKLLNSSLKEDKLAKIRSMYNAKLQKEYLSVRQAKS